MPAVDILDSINQKYDNATSGLTATNVKTAIDELAAAPGGSGVATQDEGISVDAAATTLNFVGAGVTATDAGAGVTNVTIAGGGAGAINDLSDATITTPASNEVLAYNGTTWVNSSVPAITGNLSATFSTLDADASTLTGANSLIYNILTNNNSAFSVLTRTTGKYYSECYNNAATGSSYIGIAPSGFSRNDYPGETLTSWGYSATGEVLNNTASIGGTYAPHSQGSIIGIAVDCDLGRLYFSLGGVWQNGADPVAGTGGIDVSAITNFVFGAMAGSQVGSQYVANFGQDSSFQGLATAQNNPDGNGLGDFYYAPPTGYFAVGDIVDATVRQNSNIWTPVFTDTGGGRTFNALIASGTYVRLGPLVFVDFGYIDFLSSGVANGVDVEISGLPYSIGGYVSGTVLTTGITFPANSVGIVPVGFTGDTKFKIRALQDNAAPAELPAANYNDSFNFEGAFVYTTSDPV